MCVCACACVRACVCVLSLGLVRHEMFTAEWEGMW